MSITSDILAKQATIKAYTKKLGFRYCLVILDSQSQNSPVFHYVNSQEDLKVAKARYMKSSHKEKSRRYTVVAELDTEN